MNIVIVISGTTGIGRSIALVFAAQGDEDHVTGIEAMSEQPTDTNSMCVTRRRLSASSRRSKIRCASELRRRHPA